MDLYSKLLSFDASQYDMVVVKIYQIEAINLLYK